MLVNRLGLIILNLFSPFFFFVLFVFDLIKDDVLVYYLELGVLNAIVLSLYVFKRITSSYFNIFSLFILLFFVFLSSRPILHLFGFGDIQVVGFYYDYVVEIGVVNRVLINQIIAIHGFVIGVLLFSLKNRSIETSRIKCLDNFSLLNNKKIFYSLVIISLLMLGKYSIGFYYQILDKGYLALFTGDIDVDRNIFEWFLSSFIIIVIYYCMSNPSLASLKTSVILLLIYVILNLTSGQRGPALLFFVFGLFYLYSLGRIRISFLSLVVLFVFVSVLSNFISSWRSMDNSSMSLDSLMLFPEFIWGQGISMHVLSMTIKFENDIRYSFFDLFGNIRFIFEYYLNKFSILMADDVNEMYSIALDYKIYSTYISYIVDPVRFDLGYGLGGSYIAQLYAIGKECAQLLGGILMGLIYSFIYSMLLSNKFEYRFVAFYMLSLLIYIPRDNMFDFMTTNWIVYLCLLVLVYFNNRLSRLRSKYSQKGSVVKVLHSSRTKL